MDLRLTGMFCFSKCLSLLIKKQTKTPNHFFRTFLVLFLNIDLLIKNGIYYFKIVEDIHAYVSSAVYIKNTNRQLFQYLLNKADA